MSSCLYQLKAQWKLLPLSRGLTYGISKQGRTYWQLKTPGHVFLNSWARRKKVGKKPNNHMMDTPSSDQSDDNDRLSCTTHKVWHILQNLNTIQLWLNVVLTLSNTFLCFDPTILVKGKNAPSWLVTSSNTKPCNLNTPLSRDNNTGSQMKGGGSPLKDCTQELTYPCWCRVICFGANRILPLSWLIFCSPVCSTVF